MDTVMIVAAFVAFFAMLVGWMAAPTTDKRPATVAEPGVLVTGEARA